MNIVILEPSWNGLAHCPANLGMLRVLREAYPQASLTLMAGDEHLQELKHIAHGTFDEHITSLSFQPALDPDTLPVNMLNGWRRFQPAHKKALAQADLICMLSCTASSLAVIHWLGHAHKTVAFLHGNANDLLGWRSRNPIRKWLDFASSLRRYAQQGGRVLVYEQLICERLTQELPWLAGHTHVLGHPLLQEERDAPASVRPADTPIRIGYAGNATKAKGFPEFVQLARAVTAACPGVYEFHSFSYLHPACKDIDQSVLRTRASVGLPRPDFVASLKSLDYIFAWHSDNYYSIAASGIMYDAINLGIPLLARRTAQLHHLEQQGTPIGLLFDAPDEVAVLLSQGTIPRARREPLLKGLSTAQAGHSTPQLARDFRALLAS
jgi:hypothetical protein